jgi:hypothetical protein
MFVIVEMVFGVHAEIPCTPRTGTLSLAILLPYLTVYSATKLFP